MIDLLKRYQSAGLLLLMVAFMALTRSHHFSTPAFLADASLALFFLAGWWLSGVSAVVILMAAAAVIDFFAINAGGVGSYCLSPAYPFLIPTYAAMWFGGRLIRRHQGSWSQRTALIGMSAVVSTVIAYVISEMSFFWLSGQVSVPLADYVNTAMTYLPNYMSAALTYIALGSLMAALVSTAATDSYLGNES